MTTMIIVTPCCMNKEMANNNAATEWRPHGCQGTLFSGISHRPQGTSRAKAPGRPCFSAPWWAQLGQNQSAKTNEYSHSLGNHGKPWETESCGKRGGYQAAMSIPKLLLASKLDRDPLSNAAGAPWTASDVIDHSPARTAFYCWERPSGEVVVTTRF